MIDTMILPKSKYLSNNHILNFNIISDIICDGEQFTLDELMPCTRRREIVLTRQIIWHFLRKYTKESLAVMGSHFRKDHATSLHGCNAVQDLIDTDRMFALKILNYEKRIKDYERSLVPEGLEDLQTNLMMKIQNNKKIDFETLYTYNKIIDTL
jgi:hypothetical protein